MREFFHERPFSEQEAKSICYKGAYIKYVGGGPEGLYKFFK